MQKFAKFISIIGSLALLLSATAAWAQPGTRAGSGLGPGAGMGRGMDGGKGYNRMYDPKTVETVSGEVESVNQATSGRRMALGVHLTLKTEKETIAVHLGPSWYLDKQGITLAAKDKVEVTGSRITYEGQPTIITGEVKKGGQVLKLRDAAGVPAWAGQGRR